MNDRNNEGRFLARAIAVVPTLMVAAWVGALACGFESSPSQREPAEPQSRPAGAKPGYLGVEVTSVSHLESALQAPDGLTVTRVVENSPAYAAGVKVGDRILELEGRELRTAQQLDSLVAMGVPGRVVRLAVERDDRLLRIDARLDERRGPLREVVVEAFLESRRLGASVRGLSVEETREAGLADGLGARIVEFYPGSPLESAGLQIGDIIIGLDDASVHGGEDFLHLAGELAVDQVVTIRYQRDDEEESVRARASQRTRSVKYFHLPGLVIYEDDETKDETTFGVLLNLFKYSRDESERTYRLLYFIKWTTGDNEELKRVEP